MLTYVCGYLIVSIYESSFGFTELNPFKPKILAAGILFMFLTLVGVLVATVGFKEREEETSEAQKFVNFSYSFLFYYYGTYIVASVIFAFLLAGTSKPVIPSGWVILSIAVLVGLTVFINLRWERQKRLKTVLGVTTGVASLASVAAWVVIEWKHRGMLSAFPLHMWFFVTGILIFRFFKNAKKPGALTERANWNQTAGTALALLFVFARWVYPGISIAWGGGEKTPVVLYFTKDSSLLPNQNLSVQLIEESENGFYFLMPESKSAVFIPRTFVSAVSFSKSPIVIK